MLDLTLFVLWVGKNKNKGIGVFSRNGHKLEKLDLDDDGHQSLLTPCLINGSLNLIAVSTKHANSPNFRYIGQFWKYLQLHKESITKLQPIICGDFNSNSIWDEWDRWWNHTDVVRELQEIGIESLYHYANDEEQGKESSPTLYLHRKIEKPYHIDYAFLPGELLRGSKIIVGRQEQWLEFSDHMPITVEISC